VGADKNCETTLSWEGPNYTTVGSKERQDRKTHCVDLRYTRQFGAKRTAGQTQDG
jgi:hypothetical protein